MANQAVDTRTSALGIDTPTGGSTVSPAARLMAIVLGGALALPPSFRLWPRGPQGSHRRDGRRRDARRRARRRHQRPVPRRRCPRHEVPPSSSGGCRRRLTMGSSSRLKENGPLRSGGQTPSCWWRRASACMRSSPSPSLSRARGAFSSSRARCRRPTCPSTSSSSLAASSTSTCTGCCRGVASTASPRARSVCTSAIRRRRRSASPLAPRSARCCRRRALPSSSSAAAGAPATTSPSPSRGWGSASPRSSPSVGSCARSPCATAPGARRRRQPSQEEPRAVVLRARRRRAREPHLPVDRLRGERRQVGLAVRESGSRAAPRRVWRGDARRRAPRLDGRPLDRPRRPSADLPQRSLLGGSG